MPSSKRIYDLVGSVIDRWMFRPLDMARGHSVLVRVAALLAMVPWFVVIGVPIAVFGGIAMCACVALGMWESTK